MESNTKEIEESLTYAYENKYILLFHNRKKYLFCPLCWRVYDRHALEGMVSKNTFFTFKILEKNEKKFLCFSDLKNTYIKRTIRVT